MAGGSAEETKRVLVVEDDESIRKVLNEALTEEGYDVQLANSADEAVKKLQNFKPHLLLTDHEMPGITGLELLKELRTQENYITVIFITGRTDNDLVVNALKEGADDFIKKPFRINEMLARIEASLRTNDLHIKLLVANEKLKDMVDRDYLTGLYNMRSMYEKIDFELKRAKRFGRHVACVMLDMDKFKAVNDENDHLFGSFVLKETGRIISSSIREIDFAARYGGDEFLVVLTETHRPGVEIFCERIRKTIEGHTFQDGDSSIQLTVSIGFVISGGDNVDARKLVRHADHALYQAKEEGRNKTVGIDLADVKSTDD